MKDEFLENAAGYNLLIAEAWLKLLRGIGTSLQ